MDPIVPCEAGLTPDVVDFVRFCYERHPTAWPEFYDEMTAVAGQRLFRGWGYPELAEHGVSFTLAEMPRLAALVGSITREDPTRQLPPAVRSRPSRPASRFRRAAATP